MNVGGLVLEFGEPGVLFTVADAQTPQISHSLSTPVFEINGVERGDFAYQSHELARELPRGGQEHVLHFTAFQSPALRLDVYVRSYPDSPFLRFKYTLYANEFMSEPVMLTKTSGHDNVLYFNVIFAERGFDRLLEVQMSHFDQVAHSYMPYEQEIEYNEWYAGRKFTGPILTMQYAEQDLLIAYEHGADHPNTFLHFEMPLRNGKELRLVATKGNYHHGQPITAKSPFTSVWFEIGVGNAYRFNLRKRYRRFFLEEVAENVESRKPYVYYNTWNHQERLKYSEGKPYLTEMTFARMMQEIEAAHQIGVDVFVIDTGWYGKTGDWLVNLERFPDGLHQIKAKLDAYGMKLGLWFNPTVAARTSQIYLEHPEYVMERDGKPNYWGQIWETEESYGMCLASDYADHFIAALVRLHRELGVVYFKWDAIGQYGCDSPRHHHGTAANPPPKRADCYAYESGRQMIRIVEAVSRQCPDVIVDFDITEGGRFVGLGFLSVGKYFLINNGPYFHDFDIPKSVQIAPNTINVFFYPGPARSRICRQGAKYDAIIPSILFLTHYLPDGPILSQQNALASLVLGGNGLWGDLVSLTDADKAVLSESIADYKQVAQAVTRAYPRQIGFAGSSPEIHEKIEAEKATGLVAFFTATACEVTHVTQPLAPGGLREVKGADAWEILPDNRLKITARLERNGARVVTLVGGEAH